MHITQETTRDDGQQPSTIVRYQAALREFEKRTQFEFAHEITMGYVRRTANGRFESEIDHLP